MGLELVGAGLGARSQPAKAKAVSPNALPVMKVLREGRCAELCCIRLFRVPDLFGLACNATCPMGSGANWEAVS